MREALNDITMMPPWHHNSGTYMSFHFVTREGHICPSSPVRVNTGGEASCEHLVSEAKTKSSFPPYNWKNQPHSTATNKNSNRHTHTKILISGMFT